MTKTCVFCRLLERGESTLTLHGDLVAALDDGFPLNAGHRLVIPRRHVGRVLDLTTSEYDELFRVARAELRRLEETYGPDAYTIGINDGPAAGQTVPHVHLHLVPREHGDNPESRGGIRWVVPERASYWENDESAGTGRDATMTTRTDERTA